MPRQVSISTEARAACSLRRTFPAYTSTRPDSTVWASPQTASWICSLLSTCAGMAQEELEDLVLAACGGHDVPADHDLAGGAVHAEVAGLEDLEQRRHAPAAQRSHPGEHLLEVEGLGEVVVGAGVEAGEPVLDVVAGGEHQDRRRRLLDAQMAAEARCRPCRRRASRRGRPRRRRAPNAGFRGPPRRSGRRRRTCLLPPGLGRGSRRLPVRPRRRVRA